MAGFRALAAELREALAALDPGVYSGHDCARAAEELAATRKACEAAEARLASRAAACGAHRERGFADVGDWLASVRGSTAGEARRALETVSAVEACPDTREALLAGELSLAQAHEIARTEAEVPGSEAGLLEVARHGSLGALRDRARERRVGAVSAEALHEKQHAHRELVHYRDELGMVCLRVALVPEIGIPFVNRLDAETDRVRREAGRASAHEARAAHAADAFARLVAGRGKGRANRADLVLVCDLHAYRRGHSHDGEPSHIVGGGPIPPSVIRDLADDAFLKVAIHDGVEIRAVAHFGRHVSAELRTALELGASPHFDGVTCCEEGCDRRYGLEWDHVDPVANHGVTSYDNLRPRCCPHHREKTERDREAGLLRRRDSPSPP